MRTCMQPDRDERSLVCGYPLPCPWHTAIIAPNETVIPVLIGAKAAKRVMAIGEAVYPSKKKVAP